MGVRLEERKAPKDPEKNRPYFYIMREKEVFGALQTEGEKKGKGIQFIYENDGRLISSAKVVGNIEEEGILKLLETAEGFRSLVYSIGISAETENPKEYLTFQFQMYGKKDLYGGGTTVVSELYGDGAEVRICMENLEWSADDAVPGQIRFEFDTPQLFAKVSVRFFLQEGFTAPEQIEEYPLDTASGDYKKMIERSLLSAGNTDRIRTVINKAANGGDVTLAYIGGSITQGAGGVPIHTECYAYQCCRAFAAKYGTDEKVHLIKAGVGGTPSELGMIRFDRDVLRDGAVKPDLVVVEFAVNDEGDETKGVCFESLVRKILMLPWRPAVVLLFAVFADDSNLQERLSPVGYHYHLPMISIKNAVTPQFQFCPGNGRVISKNQFFYDAFHPSNAGHKIMADCLMNLFKKCMEENNTGNESSARNGNSAGNGSSELPEKSVIGDAFTSIKLLDRKDSYSRARIDCGDFSAVDKELQCVEQDGNLFPTPEFPYNWQYTGETEKTDKHQAFRMKIFCRALLLIYKDAGEVDAGCAEIFLDGSKVLKADPHRNGWIHCNPVILFSEQESAEHEVMAVMTEKDKDKKFTILGFGYVE